MPPLKAIPATEPAARDEGPRLIPLTPERQHSSRVEHYVGLADVALGRRKT